jgi:hypothetical protein
MYRKHYNKQLSIEEFHVSFGDTLDPENRWVLFAKLMPTDEIEEAYAPQFSPTTGAPAKPARLAFGALFVKQRLGLSDEETVEQIRENACMQFFLGFAAVFAQADHGSACERCGNLNLHGVSGDVCRENPEAPPPLFCLYFCLILRMTAARILMDGAYAHLAACYKRTTDH